MRANIIEFALLGFAAATPQTFRHPQPAPCSKFDASALSLRERGSRNTLNWRMWLELNGNPISPWHDVPTYPSASDTSVVHFVVEIPRWTAGKVEIKRDEPINPIFHDEMDDAPRFRENVWPYKAHPFLYGSIPQTWESPNFNHSSTGYPGDNDPMDLFDIGQDPGYYGQVKQIKILGGLAVVDDNETDWKMMGIDVQDPLAELINSVEDVERYRPGTMQAFHNWFAGFESEKTPIIGEGYQNQTFCVRQVAESHGFWKELVAGKANPNEIKFAQTSDSELDSYISCEDVTKKFDLPEMNRPGKPAEIPGKFQRWFFYNTEGRLLNPEAQD
ncbi:inorganic pyrophosphatase [Boeremia exigua]|uniref:inorganic pyrophosphatase n=1 Tax=Boeremia exigua TaxID=749465 RepID=UPI001E8D98E6|nr:inorganic pyrophosphatase [Boeremia exigua]KAH6625742.1 inorganic pyrophosphatase [Boeremia exigua]